MCSPAFKTWLSRPEILDLTFPTRFYCIDEDDLKVAENFQKLFHGVIGNILIHFKRLKLVITI